MHCKFFLQSSATQLCILLIAITEQRHRERIQSRGRHPQMSGLAWPLFSCLADKLSTDQRSTYLSLHTLHWLGWGLDWNRIPKWDNVANWRSVRFLKKYQIKLANRKLDLMAKNVGKNNKNLEISCNQLTELSEDCSCLPLSVTERNYLNSIWAEATVSQCIHQCGIFSLQIPTPNQIAISRITWLGSTLANYFYLWIKRERERDN